MLTVSNLEVGYTGPPVLSGIDLEVGDGEVLAVLGPNGAGKTTLARALTGVVRPRAGTITFDGCRLDKRSPKAIVRAGSGSATNPVRSGPPEWWAYPRDGASFPG